MLSCRQRMVPNGRKTAGCVKRAAEAAVACSLTGRLSKKLALTSPMYLVIRCQRRQPRTAESWQAAASKPWVFLWLFTRNNPYAPTSHANVRFFIAEKPDADPVWWFGGGYDLTPYYGNDQDCVHWHSTAKQACDGFSEQLYPRFKRWCDDYFYLKHRDEPRGVGGLFFDDFNELGFEQSFAFMRSVGDSFTQAYLPIVQRRRDMVYGDRERSFQLYRRGRYVEFNLVHDRGTLFGLQTGGRTESILMSLPPLVRWEYDWQPEPDSAEAELYEKYLLRRDWV